MFFILGVSAHFYMPVSGLFFILNHSGILARTYSKSPQYGVPTRYHSIAGFISILVLPTYHPRELPYTLHSEILYLPTNPWTASRICHFHSCNLIFLLSLCASPFQFSPCPLYTGACHAPVLTIKEEITNENSPALLACSDILFSLVPVLPLSEQF